MQVSVARRVESVRAGELAACMLLGVGAGLAAGFLLGEGFGTGGPRRMGRLLGRRSPAHASSGGRTALLTRVREALQAEPALAGLSLEVRPRGRGLDLRGWVPSRTARALAYRAARSAAGELELVNHLLVRGEDDHPGAPQESPRSA